MPRIVDGDNLLGSWPGRSRAEEEKRALARQIDRLVRREGKRIVVAFDGASPSGLELGPDVVYSGGGRSADAAILALLRAERDPRGWVLVTGDRALADRARWLGASVESPAAFRARLETVEGEEKPGTAVDVAYWLEVFGPAED